MTSPGPRDESGLSLVDQAALAAAALGLLWSTAALAALRPVFRQSFEDFGGALPALTVAFLSPGLPLLLSLVAPALVALVLLRRAPAGWRRFALLASIALLVAQVGLFFFAMYLPVFALSEQLG